MDHTSAVVKTHDSAAIVTLPNNIAIRAYRESDIPFLSRHGDNKAIWNNCRNRLPSPFTKTAASEWIRRNLDPANHVRCGYWTAETGSQGVAVPTNYAITISNELVGVIGLEVGAPGEVYARTAEVGYWLGEEHWGKGIMGMVVPAFVQWVWSEFGVLIRLNAEVNELNHRSKTCLEKAGFVVEGFRKWSIVKNGQLQSAFLMGMLRPGAET